MDSAPLMRAHDHARAASVATHGSTTESTVAVNEHVLAAGEFATAAASTSSLEALRTIKLLEEHHTRLAELLRLPLDHSPGQSRSEIEPSTGEKSQAPDEGLNEAKHPKSEQPVEQTPSRAATSSPPTLPHHRRHPSSRDLSSSIASNLASARGIRSRYRGQPASPSVSKEQAPGNVEVRPRRDGSSPQNPIDQAGGKPSWVPPQAHGSRSPRAGESRHLARETSKVPNEEIDGKGESESEEGFSRFYSTFGSIFNRLSAPLAFAGLPLIAEESGTEPSTTTVPEPPVAPRRSHDRVKSPRRATLEPDLSAIYSRAALRAVSRDSHGPNDSFYVVPTTGHTVSYANILNWEQKERRRLAGDNPADNADDLILDEDDFVDARESPLPALAPAPAPPPAPSSLHNQPGARGRLGRAKTDRDVQNVVEELCVENASLKDMLDKVSKRLHAFELNSQTSHLALAQSLRLNRPGSPLANSSGGGGGGVGGAAGPAADGVAAVAAGSDEATLKRKNLDLEDQLAAAAKQMEALEKEYNRSQVTLEKYRDKWEKLKAGAKARREATHADSGEGSKTRK